MVLVTLAAGGGCTGAPLAAAATTTCCLLGPAACARFLITLLCPREAGRGAMRATEGRTAAPCASPDDRTLEACIVTVQPTTTLNSESDVKNERWAGQMAGGRE